MSKEIDEADEKVYYGIIIPFDEKSEAEFVLAEINKLGYGGWVRESVHGEDD